MNQPLADVPGGSSIEQQLGAKVTAHTKAARQHRILELLAGHSVRSQAQLAGLLAQDGFEITQATLSRDLLTLGAARVRGAEGTLVYAAVPHQAPSLTGPSADVRLAKVASEVLVSAQASANLVVLRTPPGAANYLASALDQADGTDLLGTIAGDDTVLLITRDATGGAALAAHLLHLAEGGINPTHFVSEESS